MNFGRFFLPFLVGVEVEGCWPSSMICISKVVDSIFVLIGLQLQTEPRCKRASALYKVWKLLAVLCAKRRLDSVKDGGFRGAHEHQRPTPDFWHSEVVGHWNRLPCTLVYFYKRYYTAYASSSNSAIAYKKLHLIKGTQGTGKDAYFTATGFSIQTAKKEGLNYLAYLPKIRDTSNKD